MSALLIGILIVVVSAALFGTALFGRRPALQSATASGSTALAGSAAAEMAPSGQPVERGEQSPSAQRSGSHGVRGPDRETGHPDTGHPDTGHPDTGHRDTGHRDPRHRDTEHLAAGDVRVPAIIRVRSAALLVVSVLGAAILVGAVLSIVVVGAVLLLV